MLEITESKQGLLLKVKVQPGAKRDELAGEYDGGIKLRLSAPPVDGKANAACVEFLAELLGIPKRAVTLVRGQTSTTKVFLIQGLSKEQLAAKIVR